MRLNIPRLLLSVLLIAYSCAVPLLASALTFTQVKNDSVSIAGKIVGRYFFVEFHTLDSINPKTSEYFISAYEDQQIPYYASIKPAASEKVPCDTINCSQAVEALITDVPYTVGIGSSSSVKTISATLNFVQGNTEGISFNPSLTVNQVGINTVIVSYQMPNGYRPVDSGAWVGIWKGGLVSADQPLGRAEVDSDQSYGTQAINGLHLLVNTTYTVGFASGSSAKDLVSSVTFKTSPY
jgi:hypothetical protein